MFSGLTFFGIAITTWLRIVELLVLGWIAALIWVLIQWGKAKRDWDEGGG